MSPDENPVDLLLWFKDGDCTSASPALKELKGRKRKLPWVSVGRTDSRRALGFVVEDVDRKHLAEFVLDKKQVQELIRYLSGQLPRLRAGGKRPREQADDLQDRDLVSFEDSLKAALREVLREELQIGEELRQAFNPDGGRENFSHRTIRRGRAVP